MPPLLFCNVGWMEDYQGQTALDQISGGGSWVAEHGTGHEVCNFLDVDGTVYGYVQAQGQGINLSRLGADAGAAYLDGVTVVWTARRTGVGTVIVGWYRNARVYGPFQRFNPVPPVQAANGIESFLIAARTEDCTLLPIDARTKDVPRQTKGGMGQSNVWYVDQPEMEDFRREVQALIDLPTSPQSVPVERSRPDQARKLLVEAAAITTCWRHYEALGYILTSVEKDNVGWDLEAVSGKTRLRIEVKGLSAQAKQIELTPNEYSAFLAQSEDYRLAVVADALGVPKLAIGRYSSEFAKYVIEDSAGGLDIQPKTGAIIRFPG